MENRYRVEISLNIWADDDKSANVIAQNICKEQQERFDNRCQVVQLFESPFGSLHERAVQLELF